MENSPVVDGRSRSDGGSNPVVRTVASADETKRLLNIDPAGAEIRAREILAGHPGNPGALWLLGAALRRQGDGTGAKAVLEPLAKSQPQMAAATLELGLTLRDLGLRHAAMAILRQTVDLAPSFPDAWHALGDEPEHVTNNNTVRAETTSGSDRNIDDPQLRIATDALRMGRLDIAEKLLGKFLLADPANPRAIRLMADTAFLLGHYAEAEGFFARCLELTPDIRTAQFQYAVTLLARQRGQEAIGHIDQLLRSNPSNKLYRDLKATALSEIEEFGKAAAIYEDILKDSPDRPGAWLAYGRALRGMGRHALCIAAFRKAIELLPGFVDAYWSLATVKTFRFDPALVDSLRVLLTRPDLSAKDRAQLHFALGKALEDTGQYAESFDNYAKSNLFQQGGLKNRADADAGFVRRCKALFTPAFVRERAGAGCEATDPIFIVGLPRSGSTLVEQILSAHSAIEGMGELPHVLNVAARLENEGRHGASSLHYPEFLSAMEQSRFASLGNEYLQRTCPRRRSDRPFFTDKFPGNFAHIGLIRLMLPNARIVDVRRHPLDCCLSCFKNYFPQTRSFYHTLSDLGRHYANYVELMAHFDELFPGKIHRLIYEQLIGDPELEVRRLLGYLGLPFEEQCLRFYEKERAVTTLSSEQVRMPLYASGVGYWRNYEPWLGPLKESLGQVLDVYPEAPKYYPQMQIRMSMRLA